MRLSYNDVMNNTWYYEKSGARVGPITSDKLIELYTVHSVFDDTLVWNSTSSGGWIQFRESNLLAQPVPPPLPECSISKIPIWILATLPLLGAIFILVLNNSLLPTNNIQQFAFYFFANTALCIYDARLIKKSGRNTRNISTFIWLIFLPVYFIQRARILGRGYYLLAVWTACFCAGIYIDNPSILNGPIYWGVSTLQCDSAFEKGMVLNIYSELPIIKITGQNGVSVENIKTLNKIDDNTLACSAVVIDIAGESNAVLYSISNDGQQIYTKVRLNLQPAGLSP